MPISTLPLNVKPREKARLWGLATLSDVELLALFLRTGSPAANVLVTAHHLLSEFGSFAGVINAPVHLLCRIHGIGLAKALTIAALGEVGRRALRPNELRLASPAAAADHARQYFVDFAREQMVVLFLDRGQQLLYAARFYLGTAGRLSVEPREIVTAGLQVAATSFYCVHNHPSGVLHPSPADIATTRELQRLGAMMGLHLREHIIINAAGGAHGFIAAML